MSFCPDLGCEIQGSLKNPRTYSVIELHSHVHPWKAERWCFRMSVLDQAVNRRRPYTVWRRGWQPVFGTLRISTLIGNCFANYPSQTWCRNNVDALLLVDRAFIWHNFVWARYVVTEQRLAAIIGHYYRQTLHNSTDHAPDPWPTCHRFEKLIFNEDKSFSQGT